MVEHRRIASSLWRADSGRPPEPNLLSRQIGGAALIKPHITDYLNRKGVAWQPHVHPRRYTAQETAAVEHVHGRRFAKTVVVEAGGRPVICVLGADRGIDLDRLQRELGVSEARLAQESRLASLFPECEIGAMPPLGDLYGIDVVVDAELAKQPSILFNAGTHEDAIEMPWSDFERLGSMRVCDFGVPVERVMGQRAA